ncbi:Uncharacterized protein FWK35_00008307 [Aphis craccivora]|uniref:Uncharacterized protein n=1 Tax=Aphis craccivora TaxID=307492 RepID=A0A6G0YSA1_APHCR|nr:Uncharacterized protein FWK35_00008307 [Aphis craccivora]
MIIRESNKTVRDNKLDIIPKLKIIKKKINNKTVVEFYIKEALTEQSDKCIDFTMIITSRNNASISNFEGGFRWQSEYPWCIIKVKILKKNQEKQKKVTEKREFLRKTSFRQNRIFHMVVTQKLITFKFLRNLTKTRKFARQNTTLKFSINKFYLKTTEIFNFSEKNLNFGVFRPLKHKPPFSPTTVLALVVQILKILVSQVVNKFYRNKCTVLHTYLTSPSPVAVVYVYN